MHIRDNAVSPHFKRSNPLAAPARNADIRRKEGRGIRELHKTRGTRHTCLSYEQIIRMQLRVLRNSQNTGGSAVVADYNELFVTYSEESPAREIIPFAPALTPR